MSQNYMAVFSRRVNKNILEDDTFEAFIGAIFLDNDSLDQSKASTFYKSEIKFLKIGKLGLILP